MCLLTRKDKIETARRTIRCGKLVNDKKNCWSPYYHNCTNKGVELRRSYKYNTILTAENDNGNKILGLTLEPIGRERYVINEGFHAIVYMNLHKSIYTANKIAVIPKGAEYVISYNNLDIVANKMIVFSSYFRYLLYRIFGNLAMDFNNQ